MNRLHYSPEALNDLDEIWTYISKELHNPAAALNTVEDILDSIDNLREISEMGPPLSSITGIESDYRFLVCGKYIAFYRVDKVEVSIDRILYGGRDYMRILFGNLPDDENLEDK